MRWIAFFVLLFASYTAEANIDRRPLEKDIFWRRQLPEKKKEKEPVIAADCEVIIDGKKAKLEDLKPGMNATFTVENGVIIRIVVITKKE